MKAEGNLESARGASHQQETNGPYHHADGKETRDGRQWHC